MHVDPMPWYIKFNFSLPGGIGNAGDTVIPIGYTGAINPFLTHTELTKELEWSISNIKGSGIKDIFKITA